MTGIFHNRLRRLCAWFIGFIFVLSGVLKLMDPLGTAFIVRSYLNFLHLDFLIGFSRTIGWLFAMAEAVTGIGLVTGIFRKFFAWLGSILLVFFTLLTAVLAICNPDMDCGCFGEAIHLTHFQSLLKNIILTVLAVIAFVPYREYGVPRKSKYVAAAIAGITVLTFSAYCQLYLPVKDFTPFAPGAQLAASMPEQEVTYDAQLIYEKNGKQESFTIENLPDSTWNFVRTEVRITDRNGKEYPMLSFRDWYGTSKDEIATQGNVLAFSIYNYRHLNAKAWAKIENITSNSFENGFRPIVLVSADPKEVIKRLSEFGETGLRIQQYVHSIDFKTAATLNRSNGGVTWIKDGTIVRKYPLRKLPETENLGSMASCENDEAVASSGSREDLLFQGFLLYLYAVLLLL